MPDDRIYDAINLFRFGPSQRSASLAPDSAAFAERYQTLVNRVAVKLWNLYNADEIAYSADLPWTRDHVVFGRSQLDLMQRDVRIHHYLAPTMDPANYASLGNQTRVAATSLILVHEAGHLAQRSPLPYHESEIACRTMESLYGEQLVAGKTYRSRVANRDCTAILMAVDTPTDAVFRAAVNLQILRHRGHIADQVLTMDSITDRSGYARDLSPEWIERSLREGWWGGLSNRWNKTKGLYLQVLANALASRDRTEWVVKIFESFPDRQSWVDARSQLVNPAALLSALLAAPALSRHPDLVQRYVQALVRLGESVAHPSRR
jgi:hypothetical protein